MAQTFGSSLLEQAKRNPDFIWLNIYKERKWESYSTHDLVKRVSDYLAFYREKKIQSAEIILIIMKESLDLFAGFFAGIIYGALPAYFAYPSPKQTKEAFFQSFENLVQFNSVRMIVTYADLDEILGEKIGSSRQVDLINHQSIANHQPAGLDEFPLSSTEAFLQFSSGTTGAKKGVKISSAALFNQIESYQEMLDLDGESKIVSWLPHYHDMGLIACMLMPFLKQIPIYMMSPFEWVSNPKILLQTISEFRCTHLWLPNFALGHLTKSITDQETARFDLSSVKELICCSEPVLYETVQKFIAKFISSKFTPHALNNCYAMAENTFAMTSTRSGPPRFLEINQEIFQKKGTITLQEGGRKITSAGKPLRNIKIKIVDESGQALGEDTVGEIIIQSDCMLECYHNNKVETMKAFTQDGYFKTGDLGFMHEGELFVVGRRKDIIIVAGQNIYPHDIELILNEEPYLIPGRNVVFGVFDPKIGTERIIILTESNQKASEVDLIPLRIKIFNSFGLSVSDIVLLPHMTLLKGTAGKISRYLNKNAYLAGSYRKYTGKAEQKADGDVEGIVLSVIAHSQDIKITQDTPLISSALIDSLNLVDLINKIEVSFDIIVPDRYLEPANFETIGKIKQTIQIVQQLKSASPKTDPRRSKSAIVNGSQVHGIVRGINGHLFHLDDDTGKQVTGEITFEHSDVLLWTSIIRTRWLHAQSYKAGYFMLIAPEKHVVYNDCLPPEIQISENRPVAKLLDHLKTTDLSRFVLYPLDILRKARAQRETHTTVSSHWNGFGVFLVYQELCRLISSHIEIPIIPMEDIEFSESNDGGDADLGVRMMPHEIAPRILYRKRVSKGRSIFDNLIFNRGNVRIFRNPKRTDLPSMVIFRDSFSTILLPLLAESFRRIVAISTRAYYVREIVESERPDVVISELAERYLPLKHVMDAELIPFEKLSGMTPQMIAAKV